MINLKKASIFYLNLICGHSSVVERLVANEKVEGSTPFARSNFMNNDNKLDIKKIFNLAIENQKRNNLQVAKDLYNEILQINPNLHEVYNNLGFVFFIEGKNEKAEYNYKKAIDIKPNFSNAHQNLGLLFQKLGNNDEAKRCFKRVIEINPNLVNAQYNLGLVFQKMGDYKEAKKCFKKVIEINPKIPEAYNNLGVVQSNMGEFKEAINNYDIAITNNKNLNNAKENLISSLTCSDSDSDNPIVDANNCLKKLHKEFVLDELLKDENLTTFFKRSNKILNNISENIKDIDFMETQTYRRNSDDLNCKRHHNIFNQEGIVPKFCFSCFKIQIEPINLINLIKLFFIFDDFKFLNNNWRKCMIEIRSEVQGTYKGYIYCSSFDEAKTILDDISPTLKKYIKYKISIKRGCTEFYKSFPNFKQIDSTKKNYMNYEESWKDIEKKVDSKTNLNKKFMNTLSGFSLSDFLIMNNWFNYAKIIEDHSYKKVSTNFIHSKFMENKVINQIELRRKEFLC